MEYCNYINLVRNNIDFNVVQYGYRRCRPNFGEKPHIWSDYLLHYVYSGKGVLNVDGRKIPVGKNQAFLIFPGQIANYVADSENPFEYRWIEFYGEGIKNLLPVTGASVNSPIIDDESGKIGETLKDIVVAGDMTAARLTAMFWLLVDALSVGREPEMSQTKLYAKQALHFIHATIGKKITVADVCRELNISRNYFTGIFTDYVGMPPKKYILKQHMDMAMELLRRTGYSIGEIAYIVGYDNPMEFTKAFVRYCGMSPSEYRKRSE